MIMKKVYAITVERVDPCEGKHCWKEVRYVYTDENDADKIVENEQAKIMSKPFWKMDYAQDYSSKTPLVTATALEVEGL